MLTSVLARIVLLAAVVVAPQTVRPPQVVKPPQRAVVRPAGAPDYDLAIVKILPEFRWDGGLSESAFFNVMLVNHGQKEIQQADVTCTMAGKRFGSLSGGPTLTKGVPKPFGVAVWGREAVDIAPGTYPVSCKVAGIIQPRGARDANPANDTAEGTVTVGPRPKPDLVIRGINLRDCETRGAAVAGRPLCAEVSFENDRQGAAITTPWTVACEIAGLRATGPGLQPIDKGYSVSSSVRFDKLPAGEWTADCTLDAANNLAETSEANNRMSAKVVVLPDASTVTYDLAITGIGSALAEEVDADRHEPYTKLEVRLKNLGTQAILQADVACTLGTTGISLFSRAGWSFKAGEEGPFVVMAWKRLADIPAGSHSTRCVASIVQPKGVTDSNAANNAMTAAVIK